jgi:perosamine synthetase
VTQLERIDELVEKKRQIFTWYRQNLGGIKGIKLNCQADHIKNTYWMVTVILDPSLGYTKEQIVHLMMNENISTRPFFYPLSSLPAYASLTNLQAREKNVVAYKLSPFGINLPCGMDMTEEKVDRVSKKLISLL